MMLLLNSALYLLCISFYCLSSIILKKIKDKHVFILLTLLIMYFVIYTAFFIASFYQGHSLYTAGINLYNICTENVPFYFIRSIDLVVSNLLLFYLLTHFPVSKVALILQSVIPISALYFFALGEPITLPIIFSIILVTIGSVISAFDKFEYPNILKPIGEIPPMLYLTGLLKSFLEVTGTIIIFIVSKKTVETKAIHTLFKHNAFMSFKFIKFDSVIHYALGVGPFILIAYGLYFFLFQRVTLTEIKEHGKKHYPLILLNGIMQGTCYGLYAFIFQNISNKLFLTIISTCDIPIMFFLAYFFLKEKIGLPQKISMVLIIFGTIVGVI